MISLSASMTILLIVSSDLCPTIGAKTIFRAAMSTARSAKITPDLKPAEDAHFFGRDFPDDHSPGTPRTKFTHPYPELQDDDKYDADYVHDRNDDGGEWKAQMEYDNLRKKIGKENWEAEQAAKQVEKEKADVEAARKREQGIEEHAKTAEDEASHADAEEKKINGARAGTGDALAQAEKELENAQKNMENCEKELEEAKAKLKALQEKKTSAEGEEAKAKEEMDAQKAKAAEVEKEEANAEKSLEEEIQEWEHAKKVAAKEKEDVGKLDGELDSAARDLKKFRDADGGKYPDGGVYNDDKGGLTWWHWLLIIMGIAVLVALGVYCFMGR